MICFVWRSLSACIQSLKYSVSQITIIHSLYLIGYNEVQRILAYFSDLFVRLLSGADTDEKQVTSRAIVPFQSSMRAIAYNAPVRFYYYSY
jgi:hypothetical protein